MASAEKRGGTWRARYLRLDGSKGSEGGYPTKTAALDRAKEIEVDLRRGLIVDPRLSAQPLREWIAEWRAAMADTGATAANRRYLIDRWIAPEWGDAALSSITWFAVRTWATRQLRAKACSQRTMTDAMSLLSTILTAAADAGRIAANPIARRRWSGTTTPRESVWVQPEQAFELYQRLAPPYNIMTLLAGWCGLRWGEMCALHQSHVLLLRSKPARHVIVIDPDLGALHEVGAHDGDHTPPTNVPAGTPAQTSRLYLGPPKPPNGAREIDIPPSIGEILGQHIATWPYPYLCLGPRGGWLQRGNVATRILPPAINGRPAYAGTKGHPARAALPPIEDAEGLTWHGLRHSHKTWMREDGIDDVLQREQLGHQRSREIGEHYTHTTPAMRTLRLDALEARWARCAGDRAPRSSVLI